MKLGSRFYSQPAVASRLHLPPTSLPVAPMTMRERPPVRKERDRMEGCCRRLMWEGGRASTVPSPSSSRPLL